MVNMKVMDKQLPFLVDTGATYSTLNDPELCEQAKTPDIVSVVGFSGVKQNLPLSTPLLVSAGTQSTTHPFVLSKEVPVNLLGRDLLKKLGATILCESAGLTVRLPDGTAWTCSNTSSHATQYLLRPIQPEVADIYWALLCPDTPEHKGILSAFLSWKPWTDALRPYVPPLDPLHVTLYYDRDSDEVYQEAFASCLQDTRWSLTSTHIVVGPQGIALHVDLTSSQLEWYKMSDEAVPHISLILSPSHQAKDLGPMVRSVMLAEDWVPTQLAAVAYSASTDCYIISTTAEDIGILTHDQISREHGREKSDHPDIPKMLDSLPSSLWSQGPEDVGLCNVSPITFELLDEGPIWLYQYPHRPEAAAGLEDTVRGLFQAGVLEPSQSQWNTPILPVEKHGRGKYRMVHDLRSINSILKTPTCPVPNPCRTHQPRSHSHLVHLYRPSKRFLLFASGRICPRLFFIHLSRRSVQTHTTATRVCAFSWYFQSDPKDLAVHLFPSPGNHSHTIRRRHPHCQRIC